jgi:hypothetical protein
METYENRKGRHPRKAPGWRKRSKLINAYRRMCGKRYQSPQFRVSLVNEHGFLNPLVPSSTGVEQATFFN